MNWIGSLRLTVGTQPNPVRQTCIVSPLLDLNRQPRSLFTRKGTNLLTDRMRLVGAHTFHTVERRWSSAGFCFVQPSGVVPRSRSDCVYLGRSVSGFSDVAAMKSKLNRTDLADIA